METAFRCFPYHVMRYDMQHWPPMHPRPPVRPRRHMTAQATNALLEPTEPAAPSPPSPPSTEASVFTSSAAVSASAMASMTSSAAVLGIEASPSCPAAAVAGLQHCSIVGCSGTLSGSPLQARRAVRAGHISRSISEPSATFQDVAAATVKRSSNMYDRGGLVDDHRNRGNSSSGSEDVVRCDGLMESDGAVGLTTIPSARGSATSSDHLVAVENGVSCVTFLNEANKKMYRRSATGDYTATAGSDSYSKVSSGSAPLPSSLPSPPPPSSLLMYPHPPPVSPPSRPHHLLLTPSASKKAATAAAVAVAAEAASAEALAAMSVQQRALGGRSAYGFKHSTIRTRLETLVEEGHQRPGSPPPPGAGASTTSTAAVLSLGDSSSSDRDGGENAGPWIRAPGGSSCSDGFSRRQAIPERSRRSTFSTNARHMMRRRRLTGEPGCSSGDDSSSSSSSDDGYLQALFRPLRVPPRSAPTSANGAPPAEGLGGPYTDLPPYNR